MELLKIPGSVWATGPGVQPLAELGEEEFMSTYGVLMDFVKLSIGENAAAVMLVI